MTQLTISDTIHSITVDDPVYNVNVSVDDTVYTIEIASAAADTTVTTSGSGISLINTSAGGQHVLNSLTAGANVTLTDDDAGNLTIAATEDNLTNNDTDDLSEGSTNLYYTDARADARAELKDVVRATAANAYADTAEADAKSYTDTRETAITSAYQTYADTAETDAIATAAADATAKVAVLTSGADAAWDTLVEIKNLMDSGDTTLTNSIAALNHDTLSGFVANEHIDWTVTGNTIHADNYTDTDTIYTDAEAISAVEGEDTLNFSEVTANDLSVRTSGTIVTNFDTPAENNETQYWPFMETYNEFCHLPLAVIPAALGGNSPAITGQSYNVTTAYLLRDADNRDDNPGIMTLTHQYDMDLSGNAGYELESQFAFDVADELGEHPVAEVIGQTRNSTYGGSDRKTVEGVALTDPCQITSTGHGLSNDDIIRISQVNGTTELNDRLFKVSNTATDTFELKEKHPTPTYGWQDCDATGYSTYTDDDEGLIKNSYLDEFTGEIVFKTYNKTGPAINNWPLGNLDNQEVLLASSDKVEVKSPFQLASYDTTERDALSVSDGTIIYNSEDHEVQAYADGSWVPLH